MYKSKTMGEGDIWLRINATFGMSGFATRS